MVTPANKRAVSHLQYGPAFRVLAMVVLVLSLGIEVLSCTFVECAAIASAERNGGALCLESLQVCNDRDTFGVLFDVPVILTGALCLLASPAKRRYLQHAAACVPDGFRGAIDHPPHQFSS